MVRGVRVELDNGGVKWIELKDVAVDSAASSVGPKDVTVDTRTAASASTQDVRISEEDDLFAATAAFIDGAVQLSVSCLVPVQVHATIDSVQVCSGTAADAPWADCTYTLKLQNSSTPAYIDLDPLEKRRYVHSTPPLGLHLAR